LGYVLWRVCKEMKTVCIKKDKDYELSLSVVTIEFPKEHVELTITQKTSDMGVNQTQFYLTQEEVQNFAWALLQNES